MKVRAQPRFIPPTKARLTASFPKGTGWLFEVKLDGIRAVAVKNQDEVQLFSRRPRELSQDYPKIVAAVQRLPAKQLVLDGEIVALDENGRSSFQLLQQFRMTGEKAPPLFYYIFDLLHIDGEDTMGLPLVQRKALLRKLLRAASESIRFSPALTGNPADLWAELDRLGLEGLIIKQRDSLYQPDQRSGAWLKLKRVMQQELVIGGYTPPQGSRPYFGAILTGYYEGSRLVYAGKVGTGFNDASLKLLYGRFQLLRSNKCPFANLPLPFGEQAMPPSEMRRCVWLRPLLVGQVKFTEWTAGALLRQPVFLGLREDKPAREVVRESATELMRAASR